MYIKFNKQPSINLSISPLQLNLKKGLFGELNGGKHSLRLPIFTLNQQTTDKVQEMVFSYVLMQGLTCT